MSPGDNIETKTWFNNKQVVSIIVATVICTFFVSGYIFTSDNNNVRLNNIESLHKKDFKTIEETHETAIKNLKEEMKIIGKFFQDQLTAIKEDGKRRTNTIRDRTDARLDKLELSGSDKK